MRDVTPRARRSGDADGAPEKVRASGAGELNLNIRSLEVFVTVVDAGSMTRAARRLGLTQSAVSQTIIALENAVGAALLDRAVRPPALTLAGATVMKHALALVDRARALQRALDFFDEAPLPALRIGVVDSFATMLGPHLVNRLRNIAAEWRVSSGPHETSIAGLVERRVDFIITTDVAPVPEDLKVVPLLAEPYFLIVPASLVGPVGSLRQLAASMDFVRYGRHLYIAEQIERHLEASRVAAPRRFQLDTIDAVISMVDAGLGWTIATPLAFLKGAGGASNVRCLPMSGPPLFRHIKLVARKDEGLVVAERIAAAAIEALETIYLRQVFTTLPWLAKKVRVGGKLTADVQPARRRRRSSAAAGD